MTMPETIYAKSHGWLVTPEGQNETGAWFVRKRSGHSEYILKSTSDALIAAAFEAAAGAALDKTLSISEGCRARSAIRANGGE